MVLLSRANMAIIISDSRHRPNGSERTFGAFLHKDDDYYFWRNCSTDNYLFSI